MSQASFLKSLKNDDAPGIIVHLTSEFDNISLKEKVNILIKNLCSLSIKTLEIVLPMFHIAHDFGKPFPIYIKAVECDTKVFGFINSYYSPTKKIRENAYTRAVSLGKLENLKKIRGVNSKLLRSIRDNTVFVSDLIRDFVNLDYKTSSSRKDDSPEDFLKRKQIHDVNKNMYKEKMKSQESLTKMPVKIRRKGRFIVAA